MLAEQIQTKEILENVDGCKKSMEFIQSEAALFKVRAISAFREAHFGQLDMKKISGLTDEDISKIVNDANAKIKEFDELADVAFTEKAALEINSRKSKEKSKYVRIMPVFDGYDFEVTNEIEKDEVVLNEEFNVISDKRTQRFLKGVTIDFSAEEKDFIAKRN